MGIQINGNTDTISAIDGGLIVSGADFTGVSAGTTAAPSISPTGDSNTGIFFPSADTVAIAEGGVEAFRITSTGQLQATGAADVRLTLGSGGTTGTNDSVHIRADGANLKFMNASGGATIFEQNGTERVRISTSGNLGIGTNNPFTKAHIEINAVAGAGSGNAAALWLRNSNQTANNSATIFAGNDSSAACAAINFVHANYSNNQGFISFDTRENALTYNSNAMKIDAYGRVTSPYQPMAYVTYSGTAITRANIIPFTAVTNQGGHWNNSTYRFTCPVAGVYHASLNMTGNTTQSVQVQSSIRQNASSMAMSYYPGGPVSISILCAANDYIDFYYNHDNAGYPGATPAQASVYLLG